MLLRAVVALLFALPAVAPGQGVWEELGDGSATPPGVIRIGLYNPALTEPTRRERGPQLFSVPGGGVALAFHSRTDNTIGEPVGFFALGFDGAAWGLLPGDSTGSIYSASAILVNGDREDVDVAFGSAGVAAALAGNRPRFTDTNAFVGVGAGGPWAGRGGSLEGTGVTGYVAYNPQVVEAVPAWAPDGALLCAYTVGSPSARRIWVRRWDGTAWTYVGCTATEPVILESANGTTVRHPALAVIDGAPVLAWTRSTSLAESVRLRRYNAGEDAWEELAGSGTAGVGSGRRAEILPAPTAGQFFLLFEDVATQQLRVRRWNGAAFSDDPSPLAPFGQETVAVLDDRLSGVRSAPSFAATLDSEGKLVVAWRAPAGTVAARTYQLFAAQQQAGGTWSALGDTSDTAALTGLAYDPTGVDGVLGHFNPSILVGPQNRPVVAWEYDDITANPPAILVRRFSRPVVPTPTPTATPTLTPTPSPSPSPTPVRINAANGALRVLELIEPNTTRDAQFDSNEDGALDAADVERLPRS